MKNDENTPDIIIIIIIIIIISISRVLADSAFRHFVEARCPAYIV